MTMTLAAGAVRSDPGVAIRHRCVPMLAQIRECGKCLGRGRLVGSPIARRHRAVRFDSCRPLDAFWDHRCYDRNFQGASRRPTGWSGLAARSVVRLGWPLPLRAAMCDVTSQVATHAGVAELADAQDSGSCARYRAWRFNSSHPHSGGDLRDHRRFFFASAGSQTRLTLATFSRTGPLPPSMADLAAPYPPFSGFGRHVSVDRRTFSLIPSIFSKALNLTVPECDIGFKCGRKSIGRLRTSCGNEQRTRRMPRFWVFQDPPARTRSQ